MKINNANETNDQISLHKKMKVLIKDFFGKCDIY